MTRCTSIQAYFFKNSPDCNLMLTSLADGYSGYILSAKEPWSLLLSAYLALSPEELSWNRKGNHSGTPHGPGKQDQSQKEQTERGECLQGHLAQMWSDRHLLASYILCFRHGEGGLFPPPPNLLGFIRRGFRHPLIQPSSLSKLGAMTHKPRAQLSLQMVHFARFNP